MGNTTKSGAVLLFVALFAVMQIRAQSFTYDREEFYKKTPQRALKISFVYPGKWKERTDWPLVVFFHGGGWNSGKIGQFAPYAEYFAEKGMVCALVQYRLKKTDGTDPIASLMDAKSAIRYLKTNSAKYRIDPEKIVASGGSAGGHLAAAVELVKDFNDVGDDLSVNTRVAALVLFNPVVDNGPDGYGYERLGERYRKFSPFHQDKKGMADVLVMVGTKDKLIPVKTMEDFCNDIENSGGNCTLVLYEGEGHGFFNIARKNGRYFRETRDEMEKFLRERKFF
ncbi:alpha/beta hydrolase [Sinomicrobium weinanense]|uniref:Alpha/beta hydrolase n=1 Tax=Sinomicrobium weinanense TaxID=2842200 RepID=A0A926Q5F4_9FLAO|nr:alpha/beta hydrolase [Sinomicrobium weinanense]MBC9798101.1 alpha/beta hydrolase [Sinomicrobium weinanense]MBU3125833.1 alpha/beta hydrolase [Sinomicrobium weinanense]